MAEYRGLAMRAGDVGSPWGPCLVPLAVPGHEGTFPVTMCCALTNPGTVLQSTEPSPSGKRGLCPSALSPCALPPHPNLSGIQQWSWKRDLCRECSGNGAAAAAAWSCSHTPAPLHVSLQPRGAAAVTQRWGRAAGTQLPANEFHKSNYYLCCAPENPSKFNASP